jgi:hypothetical protein
VRVGRAVDGHVQLVGDGKVRQGEPSRRVHLGKVGLAFAAIDGSPGPNTPLQRAHNSRLESLRVPPLEFFEQRRSQQPRLRFKQWNDLFVPDARQRVGPRSPGSGFSL